MATFEPTSHNDFCDLMMCYDLNLSQSRRVDKNSQIYFFLADIIIIKKYTVRIFQLRKVNLANIFPYV